MSQSPPLLAYLPASPLFNKILINTATEFHSRIFKNVYHKTSLLCIKLSLVSITLRIKFKSFLLWPKVWPLNNSWTLFPPSFLTNRATAPMVCTVPEPPPAHDMPGICFLQGFLPTSSLSNLQHNFQLFKSLHKTPQWVSILSTYFYYCICLIFSC